jgi:hypothetical protein
VVPGPPWLFPNPFFTLATPAFLPALGLLAVPLLARRYGGPAALTALTLLGATLLLGVAWHVELRFLAFLVPLSALWVGGLYAAAARRLVAPGAGWPRRVAAVALGAAIAAPGAWAFLGAQRTFLGFADLSSCRTALEWLDDHAAPAERVLTFDPWFASWHIGRDAVMIPTGGPAELAAVARRYDARWLLAWKMFTRPRTSRTVMELGPRADGVAVTKTYEDRVCRVYRLEWERGARGGGCRRSSSRRQARWPCVRCSRWVCGRASGSRIATPSAARSSGRSGCGRTAGPTSAASSAWHPSGAASTSSCRTRASF